MGQRNEDMSFDDWFKHYPKKSAIGLARQAYSNAILFKGVSEELLMQAVTAYAKISFGKDKNYIPDPHKWLQAERWFDEDIQNLIERDQEKKELDGWQKTFSELLGYDVFKSYLSDGTFEDGTLILKSSWKAGHLKNNHWQALERCGVKTIRVAQ